MPKQNDPKKPRKKSLSSRMPYSASAQECTGLMPTLADEDYEADSYRDLYDYEAPDVDEDEW